MVIILPSPGPVAIITLSLPYYWKQDLCQVQIALPSIKNRALGKEERPSLPSAALGKKPR